MAKIRNLLAIIASVGFVAAGTYVFAQDDLDDLLKDLESDSTEETAKKEKAEEAEPEAEAEEVEESADEAEKAEEAPTKKVETKKEVTKAEEAPAEAEKAEEESAEEAADEAEEAEEVEAAPAEEAEEAAEETKEASAKKDSAEEDEVEEAPAEEDEVEEAPAEEKSAEKTAEAEPVAAQSADEVLDVLEDLKAEKPEKPAVANDTDAELIENVRTTEELRRKAFDVQARREIDEARLCMKTEEYHEAARHYGIAMKLLNDSPASAPLRRECESGIAEGLYRAALQEDTTGRRERAIKLMEKAVDMRHPKARRQLEAWLIADDPDANKTDVSEIRHRRNEDEYKQSRTKVQAHLKRSRQLLAVKDLDGALSECELVLVAEPYNKTAIALRRVIEQKRRTIMKNERLATREGMIADVDKAWRPPYAVNAKELEEAKAQTRKRRLSEDDPALAREQKIYQRMKEMRLPQISFKPPATIIDAVEFFRGASKDFDRPDIPLEQRGFNFVLRTPEALRSEAPASSDDDEGFGEDDSDSSGGSVQAGVPVIPMITASDISFYDALKLVCDSVEYKFKVEGPIVMIMHKNMSIAEMVTRSYPVVAAFMDRMDSASNEMKEMKSSGFGGGSRRNSKSDDENENKEKDWKEFFEMLGVQWPEGSSIMYIKATGKLRVKNTYENLAELEKALTEMNADPKLIEIETRFVEVCQEDLNSLGFEWILNSDYSINVGKKIGQLLHLKEGTFASETSSNIGHWDYTTDSTTKDRTPVWVQGDGYGAINKDAVTAGAPWSRANRFTDINKPIWNKVLSKDAWDEEIKDPITGAVTGFNHHDAVYQNQLAGYQSADSGRRNIGLNAFGGTSGYSNGNRYLSTLSNHISGEGKQTNDQFMRLNAFLGNADLSMILHMLSQRSDTDLLSAPKVLTRPGEEAVMKVVTEYIYPTEYDVTISSSSSNGGGNNNSSGSSGQTLAIVEPNSFTMREVGVILDVTPTLTDDGNLIDLQMNTQVVDEPSWKNYGMKLPFTGNKSLQNFQGIGEIFTGLASIFQIIGDAIPKSVQALLAENASDAAVNAMNNLSAKDDNMTYYDVPMEQPFFHVRSIDSKVSVYPGATIVMGGLITEVRKSMDDKVPFLGDIPIIGRLFRSHAEMTNKRNLLIFVTTRLVDVRGREVQMSSLEQKEDDVVAAPEE